MVRGIFCSRFVLHTCHHQSIYWQPQRDNLHQKCDLVWHVGWLLHPRRQPSPPPQLHNPTASWACTHVRPWSSWKVHLDNSSFSSRSCTGVGWPRPGGPECGHRCISAPSSLLLPSDSFGQSFGWCLWPGVGIPFVPNAPHHATGSPSGLLSAVRKDAPIQSTINCCSCLATTSCYCRGMAIISWRAWASRVAVWVWQFLWLDKRNSGHLPVCSGALGGWPDGHASEEYQTQSYFCLSSRSAPDGSQGLPESPAVLPRHDICQIFYTSMYPNI